MDAFQAAFRDVLEDGINEIRAEEREANGGKPITRTIDGELYCKSYGIVETPDGQLQTAIAWIPSIEFDAKLTFNSIEA